MGYRKRLMKALPYILIILGFSIEGGIVGLGYGLILCGCLLLIREMFVYEENS